jgi:NAD(P)-dependent dehydrogenase (short-subunit alcohol dehydrogenase family)
MASKLAQTKLIEFLAAEHSNLFAATVHPGMIETNIFTRSGAKAESLPMDKGAFLLLVLALRLQDLGES